MGPVWVARRPAAGARVAVAEVEVVPEQLEAVVM